MIFHSCECVIIHFIQIALLTEDQSTRIHSLNTNLQCVIVLLLVCSIFEDINCLIYFFFMLYSCYNNYIYIVVIYISGMKVRWLTCFTCTLWYQLNVWERCKIFLEKVMNCFVVCVYTLGHSRKYPCSPTEEMTEVNLKIFSPPPLRTAQVFSVGEVYGSFLEQPILNNILVLGP